MLLECVAFSALCLGQKCLGQQPGSIRVSVVDNTGASVPEAEVHIVDLPSVIGLPTPTGVVWLRGVPPGTYQVSAKSPGFKDETVFGISVFEGKTTEVQTKLQVAPPKASDFRAYDSFDPKLYSQPLAEIGEPVLCPPHAPDHETYRFLWAPTFVHPVFLRVDINSDGTANLLTCVWKGEGGYGWGKPKKNVRKLTQEEESDLFAVLADIGFWTLPTRVENPPGWIILDGTEWFIEGSKSGNCHVVQRYSSPLTGLFEEQFLAKVAKISPYYKPTR